MNEPQQHSQAISNVGVFGLSVLFAVLAWSQDHTNMRHGLFAAAVWTGGVFTMRMLNAVGVGDADDARQFNGWFSVVIGAVLVATWIAQWWAERVVRRAG